MTQQQDRAREVLTKIIRPTLTYLGLGGRAAEQLVLGTGIQESGLAARRQSGGGPALGLFQMEPATFLDVSHRGLNWRSPIQDKVERLLLPWETFGAEALALNDYFACAFCRFKYFLAVAALPTADDLAGLAAYYKRVYNTPLGAATEAQYLMNWQHFVTPTTFTL